MDVLRFFLLGLAAVIAVAMFCVPGNVLKIAKGVWGMLRGLIL